jgi:signal transduction histidine kinase
VGDAMTTVRFLAPDPAEVRTARFTPRQQAILESVNQKIGGRESLESVLDFLAESLREITPCDRFSLAFVEEDGRRLVSRYTRAFYEPVLLRSGYAEDLAGSSLEGVIQRGAPRVIDDLQDYLREHPDSRSTDLLVREGVRSSLTCPLRVDDRVVGVLFRSTRQPNAYDDLQVLFHVAIGERLSQAVEKAYHIGQLSEANRQYFELLGFVTHELKSPLGSMLTEAGLLRDGYLGELQPQQLQRIEKIVTKGRYLLGLVSDYLELARMEGGQVSARPRPGVSLAQDVIEPAVEIVATMLDEKDMHLTGGVPADLPTVELDPQLIKIVVVNLLSNAAKYGHDGGEVCLNVKLDHNRLRLSVWNEGVGFPAAQRDRLFRKFSRLDTPALLKQKGTGVGLYTAWRIARMHGGRMDATSEEGRWAEFSLTLPQPLPPGIEADS